jgi:hypothetical protein
VRAGTPVRARITLHDGRAIESRVVVDTGTLEPLVLRPSFAAAHGVAADTQIETVQLGKYVLHDLSVTVVAAASDGAVD